MGGASQRDPKLMRKLEDAENRLIELLMDQRGDRGGDHPMVV
jgi:hypothetical protein